MKSGPAATVLLLCKSISQEDTLITHHGRQAAGADRKVIGRPLFINISINLIAAWTKKLPHKAFNNYVAQILPSSDSPTPSSGQKWAFYLLSTLCHVTPRGLSTDPLPLFLST